MNKTIWILLLFVGCSHSPNNEFTHKWLEIIHTTRWKNNSSQLDFNREGTVVSTENNDSYTYDYSTSPNSGIYFTNIEFIPQKWYLFVVDKSLFEYGPFFSTNDISTNVTPKIYVLINN